MINLVNKNILIISPESWDHIFVSKHHYAIELAKAGNKVYFLNPPSGSYGIKETLNKDVFELNYKGFIKGLSKMPKWIRKKYFGFIYDRLRVIANTNFDIIWSFDNSVFYDLDFSYTDFSISHIVDENMSYQFERAASSANICLASSKNLVNRLKSYNLKSFFINHGYAEHKPRAFDLPPSTKLKVGYAGNMQIQYLDWKLLKQLSNLSFVSLYLAGTGSPAIWGDEIFHLGRLDKESLAYFYQQMDILVIAYKADDFPDQLANPHKMMEYLATGKPIVATKTIEYLDIDVIAMTHSNSEFLALFIEVANSIEFWNSNDMIEKRKSLAFKNTYQKQIKRIERLIYENE